MLKKILCTFLLMTNVVWLSGCWGYREINDSPIVVGAAIDKINNEEYMLTTEILKTSETIGGTKEINTVVLQTTGKTIFDAVRKLIVKNGRFLYWANIKLVIINKEIAEEDIISVLDFLYRDIEVRAEAMVIVTKDKAMDIFKENKFINEPISFRILDIMTHSDRFSKVYPSKMYEVLDFMLIDGKELILPIISCENISEKSEVVDLESAVFKGKKMIGTLTGEEVQTYRLLSNNERGGIRVDEVSKDETSKISYEIEKSKAKIKPIYEDGKITMNIYIITDVFIAEVMNYKLNFMDEDIRKCVKESLEENIKGKSRELLSKIQGDLNSDLLGFGQLTKIKYPSVWKKEEYNWDKVFPNINVNINVEVNFKGSALYTNIIE